MNLSTRPFRWISGVLLSLVATAMALLAANTFRRPDRPGSTVPPAPVRESAKPPAPPKDEPRLPQVWVIAIGIDQYQDEAIPSSHGAVHDARSLGRWFSKTAGWKPDNVLLMDDLGQAEPGAASEPIEDLLPTRANLDWAFRLWLGARVRPEDRIVVFYAGQSIALPSSPTALPGTPGRTFFLPVDAVLSKPERTGWHLDEAIDPWAATGRNAIVCWLDTSLQGRGQGFPHVADTGPAATSLLPSLVRWPEVTAWLAAEHRPAAEAAAVGGFSPFTGRLLAALGTPERPANLLACLDALTKDQALTRQGFRTLGGIDPNLTLWSSRALIQGLAKRELLLQRGHAGGIAAMAFTADGSRLVTGSQDSTIKVWSVLERSVLQAFASHLVGVNCLDLSPDGRWLASGDGSGRLRVHDMVRNLELPTGPPHERGVDAVAFLDGAEHLVSLDLDGTSWLWNTADPATGFKPLSQHATALARARRVERSPFAFALAEIDGKVRLFGRDGQSLKTLDGPGGAVTGRKLVLDGGRLAAADAEGRAVLWDVGTDRVVFQATLGAPIDALALATGDWLAIAAGREIALVGLGIKEPQVRTRVALPEPANELAFSNDGRWLAASTATGGVRLWKLTDEGLVEPTSLEDAETGRTATLAFAPDSRSLSSGDQDGGLRAWDLPDGHQRPPVPPRRGQVAGLSVSEDGRYLLQISQDWHAQVWDLQEGRALSRLAGRWTSGAVAPDGETLYLTREDDGNVVAVDRAGGRPRRPSFERPTTKRDGGPATQRFGRLSVSRDGRWVAAGSIEGPLACVWEASTGRLVQTLEGHQDPHPITSVGFSAAADRLLTASEDGTAIVWDLSDPSRPAPSLANHTLKDPANGEPVPVNAAALAPTQPLRVVTGGINGQLLLWEPGAAQPLELGQMDYSVLAVTFTPDGRWLAATGADKAVWLWELNPTPRRIRLEPMPHHSEQINALIAWPGGKVIATGSDDTTIRFWSLETHALLGTLSAEQGTTDWVAYTPDGLFDSSIGGERQVTWRDDRGFLALEQIYDQFFLYMLTDKLRRGVRPVAPERPRRPPPRLSIDLPAAPVQVDPQATLTISLGEPSLSNLRLYQNGVPVQTDEDFHRPAGQKRITTRVRLRHGLNRFHVMAGRSDLADVEGRSSDVEIRCEGSDPPGRVHVLALGVSDYSPRDRALRFADRDARELAGFLYGNGQRAGAPGLKIVLTDRQVTEERVNEAFVTIREQVKERPEDTVVVFLAGHADVLNGRFALLLSSFPFTKPAPGMRNLAGGGPVDPDTILPYVALYRNISRLGALQRLVVIDACQAEAIEDDPGVRKIQETIDGGSRKARTAYLLAARRGEPANEAAALEHGMMTYALLKGLGDPNLQTYPGIAFLDEQPNADLNRDRVITTEELRSYISTTLPILAGRFPDLVQRAGIAGLAAGFRPDANLDQSPRVQASDSSFSLIELPKEDAQPADGRKEP